MSYFFIWSKISRFNENINFILYLLKSQSLKPLLSSWCLLHHLTHCFINKIHYNTFYTPTTVSSQLYFPLRFSDQNSACVCRIPLTWNTSFPPEPSSFHQPSNISSRLIIKEHLAICTHGGFLGMSTMTSLVYRQLRCRNTHIIVNFTSVIVIWWCIFLSYRHLFC